MKKAGYYETPNINIPLNNREKGEIAQVALDQLAAYEGVAATWPILRHVHHYRECRCCGKCDQTLWFNSDPEERPYQYTGRETLALIVAHIRQIHSEAVTP